MSHASPRSGRCPEPDCPGDLTLRVVRRLFPGPERDVILRECPLCATCLERDA